ncbi:Aste57867_16278 [Aphanomyces stellatus]|uniref:UV excision repair protein RAD23 n=1 Tax=Aphanomyces stellatus TaxID=120398 RepID=A0A485L8B6_9STRA|nr:hypothetical protein As57867_016221 [Aphanomyces stellatus]VFT93054.1 Aste57867_16278 [Aphanomyces stellatus]
MGRRPTITVVVLGTLPGRPEEPAVKSKDSASKKRQLLETQTHTTVHVELDMQVELAWSVLTLKGEIATRLQQELQTSVEISPEVQFIAVNGRLVCDGDSLGQVLLDRRTVVCAIDAAPPVSETTTASVAAPSDAIQQLCFMGFSTTRAVEALQLTQNNVEAAVAFLTDGVHVDASGQDSTDDKLAEIALKRPYYLFTALQQCNPDHLMDLSLARMDAAMARRAAANEARPHHDVIDVDEEESKEEVAAPRSGGDEGTFVYDEAAFLQEHADSAAVERLQAMGFGREDAYNAYVACGRNENNAANLLLEAMY